MRNRHHYPRLVGIIATSLLFPLFSSCTQETAPVTETPAARPLTVKVITLASKPWMQSIEAYGVVEPLEEANISIDFSATVEKVLFKEGQTVQVGETLLEFDPQKRALRLEQAEQVAKESRVRLEKTKDLLERRRSLRQSISAESLRQTEPDFDSAKAQLAQSLAALNLARRELQETTLKSPVTGKISKRSVEPGETVMVGTVLATVQATDILRILTHVTQDEVNSLRVGDEATVTAGHNGRGKSYKATVESIGIKADSRTGTFPVKLIVDNALGLLRDGMSARVTLKSQSQDEVLLVPREAVVDRNLRRVVYKLVDGHAVEVEPAFVATMSDQLPVLDGLKAGDVLIQSGLDAIVDGSPVEVVADADSSS